MRQIKFRVWDKELEKWASVRNLILDRLEDEKYYGFPFVDNERFIFQQFTGLQDENGKDIYEGDYLSGRETPILVEYYAPSFIFRYRIRNEYYIVGWADFEGEIIGNNIQNPNLGSEIMVELPRT